MSVIEAAVNLFICIVHAMTWREKAATTEKWPKIEIASLTILHMVLFLAFSASAAHAL